MEEETMLIRVATKKELRQSKDTLVNYRYLFWACTRNYIYIVYHILSNHAISPYLAEKKDMRSPFMAAIENNQIQVINLFMSKRLSYPND